MTEEVVSQDQLAHLKELAEICQTALSPGWMRIMKRLEELAEEAHEAMIAAGDAPDVVLAAKTRRWTQRIAMVRDIQGYVDSCKTEKDEILKSLEKENAEDRTA